MGHSQSEVFSIDFCLCNSADRIGSYVPFHRLFNKSPSRDFSSCLTDARIARDLAERSKSAAERHRDALATSLRETQAALEALEIAQATAQKAQLESTARLVEIKQKADELTQSEDARFNTLLDSLANSRGLQIKSALDRLADIPKETRHAAYLSRFNNSTEKEDKLSFAVALSSTNSAPTSFLFEALDTADTATFEAICLAFDYAHDSAIESIRNEVKKANSESHWERKTRLSQLALYLQDPAIAEDMTETVARPNPVQRTRFILGFPKLKCDLNRVHSAILKSRSNPLKSGILLAIAQMEPSLFHESEKQRWSDQAKEWLLSQEDTGVHSAALWLLSRWNIQAPDLQPNVSPSKHDQWFVNPLGITMLKVTGGILPDISQERISTTLFRSKNGSAVNDLTRIKSFWLSDQEITNDQFRAYLESSDHLPTELPDRSALTYKKPQSAGTLEGSRAAHIRDPDLVFKFCNWLSRHEQRSPCYLATKKTRIISDKETTIWERLPTANGYRIPMNLNGRLLVAQARHRIGRAVLKKRICLFLHH